MRTHDAYLGLGSVLLAGLLMTATAAAADEHGDKGGKPPAGETHAGDLWETTSQMSMEGMPFAMPPHPVKVCARHAEATPPIASDPHQKCENANFHRSGSTVSWTVTCRNPPMTGVGQVTYQGSDAYSGTLKFSGEGGAMTIKLTGRKIGGCDKPLE